MALFERTVVLPGSMSMWHLQCLEAAIVPVLGCREIIASTSCHKMYGARRYERSRSAAKTGQARARNLYYDNLWRN
ncbi:hypothetical protein HYDPIDRAFT_114716 [Hydnomerulius pinastri MD-312]|uniref:Uncharacterized protein n=1 Tax=Hydnomerulius pinastri MD-312 TaxID=994086 RepID=A0A0C9WD81_9AGAM|nr:hypothetical protein HYDPIDRAFT_114716 [Hydnomerulius pinastri MD-312]